MTALSDRTQIEELKARYCRLLDTQDWEGFAALFVADVVIDTSGSGGPRMEGRDVAVAAIRASLAGAVTVHHVHAPEIAVEGDAAVGIWAMSDELRWPGGRRLSGRGHYHERYVRDGAGWRIAASRLTRLLLEMEEA